MGTFLIIAAAAAKRPLSEPSAVATGPNAACPVLRRHQKFNSNCRNAAIMVSTRVSNLS